jgi:hypothetical protein
VTGVLTCASPKFGGVLHETHWQVHHTGTPTGDDAAQGVDGVFFTTVRAVRRLEDTGGAGRQDAVAVAVEFETAVPGFNIATSGPCASTLQRLLVSSSPCFPRSGNVNLCSGALDGASACGGSAGSGLAATVPSPATVFAAPWFALAFSAAAALPADSDPASNRIGERVLRVQTDVVFVTALEPSEQGDPRSQPTQKGDADRSTTAMTARGMSGGVYHLPPLALDGSAPLQRASDPRARWDALTHSAPAVRSATASVAVLEALMGSARFQEASRRAVLLASIMERPSNASDREQHEGSVEEITRHMSLPLCPLVASVEGSTISVFTRFRGPDRALDSRSSSHNLQHVSPSRASEVRVRGDASFQASAGTNSPVEGSHLSMSGSGYTVSRQAVSFRLSKGVLLTTVDLPGGRPMSDLVSIELTTDIPWFMSLNPSESFAALALGKYSSGAWSGAQTLNELPILPVPAYPTMEFRTVLSPRSFLLTLHLNMSTLRAHLEEEGIRGSTLPDYIFRITIAYSYSIELLHGEEFPPDSHRGYDLPGERVAITEVQCRSQISDQPWALRADTPGRLCHGPTQTSRSTVVLSEPVTVEVAAPDFSMPYNVMTLISTSAAYILGSILNVTARKSRGSLQWRWYLCKQTKRRTWRAR